MDKRNTNIKSEAIKEKTNIKSEAIKEKQTALVQTKTK